MQWQLMKHSKIHIIFHSISFNFILYFIQFPLFENNNRWKESTIEDIVPAVNEPEDGLEPLGLKKDYFNKQRARLISKPVVASRFTRPFLKPDYPDEQKIMDIPRLQLAEQKQISVESIRLLWLNNLHEALTQTQLNKLGRLLSYMKNIEVLGIFSSHLTKLDIKLPNLLRLDIRYNQFGSIDAIIKMISPSTQLQQLDISQNPLTLQWETPFPPITHRLWPV